MALRRNVPLGQNFESFQASASDATRILTRNITAEWQKLEKYKELSDAKENERISCQQRLRQLHENKNIIEKQMTSTERRMQSLKNSNSELKRSLNNMRRQEDKASRDFKAEKQMLEEKIAYYQAKWRERYETRYANKPLIQDYEKAKKGLADKREELQFLKSALHGCKADIFKAKCERGKRNAEESGFYPLESFIIRVASIGAEVTKFQIEESQLLNVIVILQQNINNKERLAQLKARKAKEDEKVKSQPSNEVEKVRGSTFFKRASEEPTKRKEIMENSYLAPQKIIRMKEDSLLNKYSIKKSKPVQGVVAQTSMRQKANECPKEGFQEERIRNRMEKLKLYTPKFFSPPDLLSKNITDESTSNETRRQSDDSVISENYQTSYVKNAISNQESDIQMRPIESKNSNTTSVKALNNDTSRARIQELTNKTLQNIQRVDSGQRYTSYLKETAVQPKAALQTFKERSNISETSYRISSKPTKSNELMDSDLIQNFVDRRQKECLITNETDSLKTSQELFPNSDKQMQSIYYNKSDSYDIHEKMPEAYKKQLRFQKEIHSPKIFREFYEAGVKETRSENEIKSVKTRSSAVNEKYAMHSNEVRPSTSSWGSLTKNNNNLEASTETNLSRIQEARKEEARKREEYETEGLDILTKHQPYRSAQHLDIRRQQFLHNELIDRPMLENVNEQLAYKEDIGKRQNIQFAQKNKTSLVSEKVLQVYTGSLDEEIEDINNKQQSILTINHENKGSLSKSSNVNQELMDTDNCQDVQNVVEDDVHDKEYMTEDIAYPDFKNRSKEKFVDNTVSMDVEENQPSSITLNSSAVILNDTQNQTFGNNSEVIDHSKHIIQASATSNVSYSDSNQALRDSRVNQSENILPTSASSKVFYSNLNEASQDCRVNQSTNILPTAASNVSYSSPNQALEGFGNDRINISVSQEAATIHPTSAASNVSYSNRNEASQDSRVNQSKNIFPTFAVSNVSYSNTNQTLESFGNDRTSSSLSQEAVKAHGVATSIPNTPTERKEERNEVNRQGETEPQNHINESQVAKSQPISQLNAQESEEVTVIKYQEILSSGNSESIGNGADPNGVAEAGVFPCSSKSTTSSEMQYHTPKSTDFSSKINLNFHSPAIEEARTPAAQAQAASTAPSPFDFEKHMKVLGDLKQTPTYVYQTRQMYKSGNGSPSKEARNKMVQEPGEMGKDIFSTFSFFEGPATGKEGGPKSTDSEKSKAEETGFLSFALEDYLADSPESPAAAGKEKSMFAFTSDSPKENVKSPPGFFPLFAADTQETDKEAKSGFLLNFGGNSKAQSPEDTSSFKFLF